MTETWTDGEPTEDGYYSCSCDGGNWFHLRRVYGEFYYVTGDLAKSQDRCLATILRHCRLPEPTKALEPWLLTAAKSIREYVLCNGKPVPNDVWDAEVAKRIEKAAETKGTP